MKILTAFALVSVLFTTGCSFSLAAGRPAGYRSTARTNYVAATPRRSPQAYRTGARTYYDPRGRGTHDHRCGLTARKVSVAEQHRRGDRDATEPSIELVNVCR